MDGYNTPRTTRAPVVLKTVVHNFLFKTFCSPLLAACLLGPDVPLCCPLNEVWPFVKEVGLRFFHHSLSNLVCNL